MPAGRPRIATHLHIARGTYREDRHGPRPPEVSELKEFPAPAHLPPLAQEVWGALAPELARVGLLTPLTMIALEGVCVTYERWRKAESFLAKKTVLTVMSPQGRKPWPEIQIAKDSREQCLKYLRAFGLTPDTLSKVPRGEAKPKESPLEAQRRKKAERELKPGKNDGA